MNTTTLNVEVLEPDLETKTTGAVSIPEAPYRGLEPFRYADAPIFFARTREVSKLLRYVTIYRGVLFYGDSGAGKSSLINAGLIPELVEEGFTPDRIRVQAVENEELIIERISRTASGQPSYLPSNFADDAETAPTKSLSVKDLKKSLEALPADKMPFLIFDQFEEIVTLFEEARVGKKLEESLKLQDSILDVLVDLIGDPGLKVKLLFVFREDYLAKLHKFLNRCPDLTDQFMRLTPPANDALVLDDIIGKPFQTFSGKFGNEFSEELIKNLKAQLKDRSEATTLNLSEVQVACLKLWQADAPEALLERRKVEGLLEDYLNESLGNLPKDLSEASIALLRRMVTSSGTRNVISEDDLIVSVKKEGFTEEKIKNSLNALTNQTKLVRRERRHDTFFYQIVSEFLVPWIRRKQLEQKAQIARRKIYRWAATAVCAALLLAGLAVAYGYYTESARTTEAIATEKVQIANEQKQLAIDAKIKADALAEDLKIQLGNKAEELEKAKTQINQLQTNFDGINQKYSQVVEENSKLNDKLREMENSTKPASDREAKIEALKKERDALDKKVREAEYNYNQLLKKCKS